MCDIIHEQINLHKKWKERDRDREWVQCDCVAYCNKPDAKKKNKIDSVVAFTRPRWHEDKQQNINNNNTKR